MKKLTTALSSRTRIATDSLDAGAHGSDLSVKCPAASAIRWGRGEDIYSLTSPERFLRQDPKIADMGLDSNGHRDLAARMIN